MNPLNPMNPLVRLSRLGQSVWYDNLHKGLVLSGELKRMMHEYAVSGVTSNPTIFERAIAGTEEYDDDIKAFVAEGLEDAEIIRRLMAQDIRLAADVLAPVYRDTGGRDGFVSIEVTPALARDAKPTIEEARELYSMIGKPNVMIKIPGTAECLPAIEQCVFEGLNINVTLLFSVKRYEDVAWAYIRGLERRAASGLPLDSISSVASFFVSRVDGLADREIDARVAAATSNDQKARLKNLRGKLAVAGAVAAHSSYRKIFEQGARFKKLAGEGATPQRLLWASTGTKDPSYSDIKYVEELIEPGTVNTMPLKTLLAFADHGRIGRRISEGPVRAGGVFPELVSLGMDYDAITAELERDGIEKFTASFSDIEACIKEKRSMLPEKKARTISFALKGFEAAVTAALEEIESEGFLRRLWAKDATLWKSGPEDRKLIGNSLGWLGLPELMDANFAEIKRFAEDVKDAGFTGVVLLAMGGSSLAPLVMKKTFGSAKGYPELYVLDSTDPEAVSEVEEAIEIDKTLFVVSSKSGSTIEPLSLFEYFHSKAHDAMGENAGDNFVAITDPSTPLEGFGKKYGFRRVFLNPHDIGGRFSALSYFGLVPAALTGVDISKLLYHASRASHAARPETHGVGNPVVMLGVAIGVLAKAGRDKLTFLLSPEFASFGLWIEQLLAESTGKEGMGIVPVTGESAGAFSDYGADRLFVNISYGDGGDEKAGLLKALMEAGHPVIDIHLKDLYELGAEFFRWEIAASVAGHILGINPFDQPDVELAKKMTTARLHGVTSAPPAPPGVKITQDGLDVYYTEATLDMIKGGVPDGGHIASALDGFLRLVKDGDYIGVLAYYNPADTAVEGAFNEMRNALREITGAATQFGFGPRYLHSTGQLHKGGANNGVFIIFTHATRNDVRIPRSAFSFSELELSQAFGDMEALASKGRRVALFNMKDASAGPLKEAVRLIRKAAGKAGH